MQEQDQEGWFHPYPENKRHYFRKKKSLCGKVIIPGGKFKNSTDKETSCKECFCIRMEEQAS